WRDDVTRLGNRAAVGFTSGMLVGFVVGGIGGRLVMLVLRLTSSDRLRGIETDDGFEIGSFTAGTGFLLAATTILGGLGGLAYMGLRRFAPAPWRWVAAALLAGAIGGAAVLDEEGIDFNLLSPLWFAVVSFIALPFAFGALTSLHIERRLDRRATTTRSSLWLVPLFLGLLLTGTFGAILVVLVLVSVPVLQRVPRLRAALRSSQALWVGRALITAVFAFAAAALVRDVTTIL
ncbi:MAG: hypothetical protein JWN29_758, partial [Acidimicrobiales bacterium]|nr:hypothetical protein [Acidimicrobiales bacterium]